MCRNNDFLVPFGVADKLGLLEIVPLLGFPLTCPHLKPNTVDVELLIGCSAESAYAMDCTSPSHSFPKSSLSLPLARFLAIAVPRQTIVTQC